jgi:hypothetical protein
VAPLTLPTRLRLIASTGFLISAKLRFLYCFNAIRDLDQLACGGVRSAKRPGLASGPGLLAMRLHPIECVMLTVLEA